MKMYLAIIHDNGRVTMGEIVKNKLSCVYRLSESRKVSKLGVEMSSTSKRKVSQ